MNRREVLATGGALATAGPERAASALLPAVAPVTDLSEARRVVITLVGMCGRFNWKALHYHGPKASDPTEVRYLEHYAFRGGFFERLGKIHTVAKQVLDGAYDAADGESITKLRSDIHLSTFTSMGDFGRGSWMESFDPKRLQGYIDRGLEEYDGLEGDLNKLYAQMQTNPALFREAWKEILVDWRDLFTFGQADKKTVSVDEAMRDFSAYRRHFPASRDQFRDTLYEAYGRLTGQSHPQANALIRARTERFWREEAKAGQRPIASSEVNLHDAIEELRHENVTVVREIRPLPMLDEKGDPIYKHTPLAAVPCYKILLPRHGNQSRLGRLGEVVLKHSLASHPAYSQTQQSQLCKTDYSANTLTILAPNAALAEALDGLKPTVACEKGMATRLMNTIAGEKLF